MLMSALQLFRRHGYNGTGFREVIAHSGAPRGSIYHHFPNGKAQLGTETVAAAGELVNDMMKRVLESESDVVAGVESLWRKWVRFVESTNFEEGCPVVGVAAEAHPESQELTDAAAHAFALWERTYATAFRRAGIPKQSAEDLALLLIASLEGATVLARAARDARPLVRAGRQVALAVRSALPK
jgi:AcrR family transcriptional regulator